VPGTACPLGAVAPQLPTRLCLRPGYPVKWAIKTLSNLLEYVRDLVSYMLSISAQSPLIVLFIVHAVLGASLRERVSDGDFFNVTEGGGSWLDSGNGTLGEPLNVKRFSVTVHHPR
jgi:hypothetical protein